MKIASISILLATVLLVDCGTTTLVPQPTTAPVTKTAPTSLVTLQPTIIVQLISPLQKEMKVQLIAKTLYSEVENRLTFVLIENGISQSRTITQTTYIGPSVAVVTKGFMVIPSNWYYEYQRPIEVGEAVKFYNISSTYELTFKFVRRQTQSVEIEVESNRTDQFPAFTANLCQNCSITSLGLGKGALPGIDVQNDGGEVMVIFHDPWRVLLK